MSEIPLNIAEIDEHIAIVRENLRELVEQAAAYSGAADEELTSQRIAGQESKLALLTRKREELSRLESHRTAEAFTGFADRPGSNGTNDHRITEGMTVIGADGGRIGTVDRVVNSRIRLTQSDSGEGRHKGHSRFIALSLVADIEGQKVRLSANAAVAVTLEEEQSGEQT